ncbi:hypothetical protein [Ornithinimicrobium kibberense]
MRVCLFRHSRECRATVARRRRRPEIRGSRDPPESHHPSCRSA